MGSSLTRKRWPRCGGQCLRTSLSSYFLSLIVLLIQLPDQGSGVDPVLINAASSLPQTMIRPPTGFGQPGSNPNVISIGAVLESQEAIAQFLQVSSSFIILIFTLFPHPSKRFPSFNCCSFSISHPLQSMR